MGIPCKCKARAEVGTTCCFSAYLTACCFHTFNALSVCIDIFESLKSQGLLWRQLPGLPTLPASLSLPGPILGRLSSEKGGQGRKLRVPRSLCQVPVGVIQVTPEQQGHPAGYPGNTRSSRDRSERERCIGPHELPFQRDRATNTHTIGTCSASGASALCLAPQRCGGPPEPGCGTTWGSEGQPLRKSAMALLATVWRPALGPRVAVFLADAGPGLSAPQVSRLRPPGLPT